jgi:hypothetical protein
MSLVWMVGVPPESIAKACVKFQVNASEASAPVSLVSAGVKSLVTVRGASVRSRAAL